MKRWPKSLEVFNNAYLNCPVWSNEKKLKEQDVIKVYATHDLINFLNIN
ncbi:hypothetical protein GF327_04130 [Candidatus Woesearchaeota archaeon]|nr:hypothetical protein [Candidatus Woesearchaeota archaeon]